MKTVNDGGEECVEEFLEAAKNLKSYISVDPKNRAEVQNILEREMKSVLSLVNPNIECEICMENRLLQEECPSYIA